MVSEIVTVAVVGCGIGEEHIASGYRLNAGKFRVVAICDLNQQRLEEVGDQFGIARRTSRFEDILDMDDVDIVDICTPPGVHFDQIIAALAAGKNVVCEKPLVGSLKRMDEVMAAERQASGLLMPVFQYRFGNGIEQVRRIIDSGLAGKPYVATAETFWLRDADYYAVPWRGKWATELGGTLMGHAIHIHDLLLYLMGPVSALFGRTATRVNDIEVEDCASASVLFESGALATMSATLGSKEQYSRLRLAFENVSFESDHAPYEPGTKPWRIVPANAGIGARIEALLADWQDVAPGYATQFARLHDAITTGAPLPVTSADARRSLEIATAFYHSAETSADVKLPIGPDHPGYDSWIPAKFRP